MVTRLIPMALCLFTAAPAWASSSYYTVRPVDPKAVHLEALGAKGDRQTDDSAAIQRAIDRVRTRIRGR